MRLHREAGVTLKEQPAPLGASEGQVSFDWAPKAPKADAGDGWAVVNRKGRSTEPEPAVELAAEEPVQPVEPVEPVEGDEGEESEDGSSAGEWVTEENKHRFGIGAPWPCTERL